MGMKRMQTRMKGRMIRKVGKWEQWQDEKLECKQIVQTNLETRRLLRLPREGRMLDTRNISDFITLPIRI